MLKLLRFLFGGEPLFGNPSTKGIFRNLEVNREEMIPNTKLEHTEKNYQERGMKRDEELRKYGNVRLRVGAHGNLENTNRKKVDETISQNNSSNNNKTGYHKQIHRFE